MSKQDLSILTQTVNLHAVMAAIVFAAVAPAANPKEGGVKRFPLRKSVLTPYEFDILLNSRICDLALSIESSRFRPVVCQLRSELKATGIRLEPSFYLSAEYGCMVRTATIGLLFTDGFPALKHLARVHGIRTRPNWRLLQTLRHEVGHAFCYAHRLYRLDRFRRIFGVQGHFFRSYPDVWRPSAEDELRFRSGQFIYLYGARHPDEDFAICFQTWLDGHTGNARSLQRFARCPKILQKLSFVDDIVLKKGILQPNFRTPPLDEPVDQIRLTLNEWFAQVRAGTNYNLLPDSPVASSEPWSTPFAQAELSTTPPGVSSC